MPRFLWLVVLFPALSGCPIEPPPPKEGGPPATVAPGGPPPTTPGERGDVITIPPGVKP